MSAVRDYLTEIQSKYRTDVAGEHAYRPALQQLLELADTGLNAVNDPARTEIGMPDFVVLRQPGNIPIGIVEAKDIGNSLNRTEKTQQIKRYQAHGNLILTNYLEFRWYVNGERIETVRIARVKDGKITRISTAYGDLAELLRRFCQQSAHSVNSAQELAQRLARSAQLIAHFIERDLKSAAPTSNLQNQMSAFQKTLLPGLDIASFSDMYAQTLAYGLFASRVNYLGDPKRFSLRNAADDIPRTNPFLRQLFHHSRFDLGGRLSWLTESLVEILRHTDMDSILAHFGRRTSQSDPVVHFYETFLAAYNPSLRERRGVYYTPEPVVKYIVRSVDHILKTRFNRPLGLADENALILDPAAGTGTFLYFVIEQIKEAFTGQQGLWKSYVERHLLPRVFGFELLMAPYTVAHMNLSLQLKEAGYEFQDDERLGIYLTNTLEEAKEAPELPFAEFISAEANEAAAIKRDKPIMVVLGNPPYSGHSANKGEWIGKLVRDYYFVDGKSIGERNPKWLQDDYVKFIRFGQWRIEQTGEGVLAFITNNSYLDNVTFRGMRQQLLRSFNEIYILNLHGNSRTKTSPDYMEDVNVFDIQPGVSIIFLVKNSRSNAQNHLVNYLDLWGARSDKYIWLNQNDLAGSDWSRIEPVAPYYLFTNSSFVLAEEYKNCIRFEDVMSFNGIGYQTHRDSVAVGYELNELKAQISTYTELTQSILDSIKQSYYRLFDVRYVVFSREVNDRPRSRLLPHVFEDNLLFGLGKQGQAVDARNWQVIMCTDKHTDANLIRRGGINLFPLYLYPKSEQFDIGDDPSEFPLSHRGRRPNLSRAFVSDMEAKLGLPFQTEGSAFANGDSPGWFGPEDVFYYAYAVFHSPTYRERYAEFLKIDFPRLPLTSDVSLFAALVGPGAELVSLHLMKSPKLADYMTDYDIEGENEVSRGYPKYVEKHKRVHINKAQYFGGVAPEIWDFHIGGYRVAEKWLKDRRGRKLSYEDLTHYQKIIVALSETQRIMQEIDEAIPQFPIE
ncbi:MAG: N-6 DNA methylase [Chloroflexota bacterium]|nr:N-6 DNA methylase [Chloroflexota bacterium]